MINNLQNDENGKPAIIKKTSSPFNNDPYNNRSGKTNNKAGFVNNSGKRMKSISVPKFKGGSGGDR